MRIKPKALAKGSARKVLPTVFAVALTLSASPPASAQRVRSGGRSQPRRAAVQKGEIRTGVQSTDIRRTEHIPPTLIEDGSLAIESERYEDKNPSGNPHRPNRYRRRGLTDLRRVVVIAYDRDGIPHYYAWNTPGGGWRVKIWLEKETSPTSGVYESVDPGNPTEPQFLVEDQHEIEVGRHSPNLLDDGNCQAVVNGVRSCRFQHPGFGGGHFRIRYVEVQRGSSTPTYPVWPANKRKVSILLFYNH